MLIIIRLRDSGVLATASLHASLNFSGHKSNFRWNYWTRFNPLNERKVFINFPVLSLGEIAKSLIEAEDKLRKDEKRHSKSLEVFAVKLNFVYRIFRDFIIPTRKSVSEMYHCKVYGKILRQKSVCFPCKSNKSCGLCKECFKTRAKRVRKNIGNTVLRNELDLIASVLSKQVYRRVEL